MAQARPYAEVIGDPIDHSLSPLIHNFWLQSVGLSADFHRSQVTRAALADYLGRRRSDSHWRGCNVTMPLKLDALALADEASDRAIATGAANLIVEHSGKLLADNTDVGAVLTLVEPLLGSTGPDASITLLGTGGAARAALMGLHLAGIRSVCIQSRDLAEAYKMAVEFRLKLEPAPFQHPIASDGLINATPLGMAGQPPLLLDAEAMPTTGWVYDFVTAPARTTLVQWAEARGMRAVTGLSMLIEQAAASFELLFEVAAPRDRDAELWQRLSP